MEARLAEQMLKAAQQVEEQLDGEIDRLDKLDDDDLEKIRRQRVEQMKKTQKQKEDWMTAGHGEYTEIANEREFFDICKKSKRVLCHFYRSSTMRCKIIDKHLRILAAKHLETHFITVDVEKVPFLVERLNIRVIPTMACVRDGVTENYIRGFDGISERDDFPTELIEWRLGTTGIINYSGDLTTPPTVDKQGGIKFIHARPSTKKTIRGNDGDDDDEGDW